MTSDDPRGPPLVGTVPRIDVDFQKLEGYLKVLAYANRLELLAILRKASTLDELHLTPSGPQAGERPERSITRQAVQNHLDRLVDEGLLRVGTTERRGAGKGRRTVHSYVTDHARLFAVVEELRKLSTIEAESPLDPTATLQLADDRAPPWEEGPKLVLARGVHEGKAFPLRPSAPTPPRGWIIGRAQEAHVPLTYDPFVSVENSEIVKAGNGFRLIDLRSAKNGTFLNWRRLPVGGEAPLASGDIIGVGRSLLVFRSE